MIDYHKYNALHGYSMSFYRLRYWAVQHRLAVKENDIDKIKWIENMLTDINFHQECSLFHEGKYNEALKSLRGE